jgi:type IV secretion system protein VirB5
MNLAALFRPRKTAPAGQLNPYQSARHSWSSLHGRVLESRLAWQILSLICLSTTLVAVGGLIHVGSQSKFVPYVIEVDKLGNMIVAGPASPTTRADRRIVLASVSQFISDARTVTADVNLQRKAIFRLYAMLSSDKPAFAKMNEYMQTSTPFERAQRESVSVEIISTLQQTPDTWQVDWTETTRDVRGTLTDKPVKMRALVTVFTTETIAEMTDEQLRSNPMGIFVRDFSLSRISQ